jgi:hypothetical protein
VSHDRSLAVVYFPKLEQVTIDLSRLSGPSAVVSWFDPSSGTTDDVGRVSLGDAGFRAVKPTTRNSAGDSDWVLIITSE